MKPILVVPSIAAAAWCLSQGNLATAQPAEVTATALVQADAPAEDVAVATKQPEVYIRKYKTELASSAKPDAPWLGVGVDESTEALAAQLDLKPGQGLVVTYVATNSPAAEAGLRKFDVLEELDGQMLMDPAQLLKLVQMHREGDTVKLTFFRAGKKQSVEARIQLRKAEVLADDDVLLPGGLGRIKLDLHELQGAGGNINLEIQQAMEQARDALQATLKQSLEKVDAQKLRAETQVQQAEAQEQLARQQLELQTLQKKLGNLAAGGVSMGEKATVVVKNQTDTIQTVVKKNETGSYVIVADPAKHLTAHGADGKLLFDGAIETPAEQKKVPKAVWKEVEPMLKDWGKVLPGKSTPADGSGSGGESAHVETDGVQQN